MKRTFTFCTYHRLSLLIITTLLHACQPKENVTSINPLPSGTNGSTPITTTISGIDISNRRTVVEAYGQEFSNALPLIGWIGAIGNCQEGGSSKAFINAQLSRVNYFRAMAGIAGKVIYIDSLNRKAQKAALIMAKANALNHNPLSTWECYTKEGAQAAGKSNLAINFGSNPDFISQYIADFGVSNSAVGHRRWILSPRTLIMGTGNVHNQSTNYAYNALWVISDNYFQLLRNKTREEFIAWPAPGYIPYQLVYPRWSFQFDGADFSQVQIKVMHNSAVLTPKIVSNQDNGYGDNAVVWEMEMIQQPSTDLAYEVTVQNVKINNQLRSFMYKVVVIDPK